MSLNWYLNDIVFIEEVIPWNGSFLQIATPVGDTFLKRHAACFKNSVFLSMKDCQLPAGNHKTQLIVFLTTASSGHLVVLANFAMFSVSCWFCDSQSCSAEWCNLLIVIFPSLLENIEMNSSLLRILEILEPILHSLTDKPIIRLPTGIGSVIVDSFFVLQTVNVGCMIKKTNKQQQQKTPKKPQGICNLRVLGDSQTQVLLQASTPEPPLFDTFTLWLV